MTTNLTKQYWLNVFDEWAGARLSGPQYDEAHKVLLEAGLDAEPESSKLQPDEAQQ